MTEYKYDAKKLRRVPIIDILSKLGYSSKKQSGNDWWYISPFRNEKTPSFKVDIQKNLWFDFGEGQGGDVIKLVENIYSMNFADALKEIDRLIGGSSEVRSYEKKEVVPSDSQPEKQKDIVKKVQSLQHPALLNYLEKRRVNLDIAKHYLKEIYYNRKGRDYFAIAFADDNNEYELRNENFKGKLTGSSKTTSTILSVAPESAHDTLLVFEGFIDFLSFFTVKKISSPKELLEDVIVLNSLSLSKRLLEEVLPSSTYTEVHLYLDTDGAGRSFTNKIMLEVDDIKVVDQSNLYARTKGDLNDYLMK